MAETEHLKDLVLVVEDETLIRMDAADMIRALGFDVMEAADADRAIGLLESVPDITVLFTDVQMPGSMDGLALASVARDRWPPISLLITSGQSGPPAGDMMPARAQFISKPYSALQLKDQLHSLARHAPQHR